MPSKIETLNLHLIEEAAVLGDTVFHMTPAANAPAILENGLQPNPERGQEESWRKMEQFMDDIRPEHIRELGISRRSGVFAYPDIEVLKPRYVHPRDFDQFANEERRAKDDTAFAIDVDPTRTMVFDMWDLQTIPQKLEDDERFGRTGAESKALEAGIKYWNNGLTLAEYRERYETRHDSHFSDDNLKDEYRDGSDDLKYSFWTPEVIVPGPIIGDRVRWAASKITLKDVVLS